MFSTARDVHLVRREQSLDGIRGIAIALVLLVHTGAYVLPTGFARSFVGDIGVRGVDVFFVLSGFLITRILLRSRESPTYFRDFYFRRARRILPLYGAFLLAYIAIITIRLAPPQTSAFKLFAYPFFLQNLLYPFGVAHAWPLDVSWSLCVEERFYLLWPLVLLAMPRERLQVVCLGAIALSVGIRFAAISAGVTEMVLFMSPAHMDGLAIGALIAIGPWGASSAIMASIVGVALVMSVWAQPDAALASLQPLASALVTAAAVSWRKRLTWLLSPDWLAYLGRRSYGLYLIHPLVFFVIGVRFPGISVVAFIVFALGATFVLAELSWRFLEEPILRPTRQTALTQIWSWILFAPWPPSDNSGPKDSPAAISGGSRHSQRLDTSAAD